MGLTLRANKDRKLTASEMDGNLQLLKDLAEASAQIISTQEDFDKISQLASNTTVLIKGIFNLNGSSLILPSNCILKFNKNTSIYNGVIVFNSTFIDANIHNIGILNGVSTSGTLLNSKIYPEWFMDGGNDWHTAIQHAIDIAYVSGGEVILSPKRYTFNNEIVIPDGVNIKGSSRGNTAFGSGPVTGTILNCISSVSGRSVIIRGKNVNLSNLTILGENRYASTIDGLIIDGVGDGTGSAALLEGIKLDNILIHSHNRGFYIVAGNSGAVTYSNFDNVRVRDCQHHLDIEVKAANPFYNNTDNNGNPYILESAFINSNTFSGFYSSGFSLSGIRVITQKKAAQVNNQDVYLPANNLIFDRMVLESPYSQYGHIRLEGGGSQIRTRATRIESLQQDSHYPDVPVVYLGQGTNGSIIDLDQASVHIVNLGYNNSILSHGTKTSIPSPNSDNLYTNSALIGLRILNDGINDYYDVPGWTIQEQYDDGVGTAYAWRNLRTTSSITIAYAATELMSGYKALSFTVPPKYQLRIYQNFDRDEKQITNAKVHAYVITENSKDLQFTYQDAVTGILASGANFGTTIFNGGYESLGGWFPVTPTAIANYYRIALFCQNIKALGSANINFTFTQPQFVKGAEIKNDPAKFITELGGIFFGPVGHNLIGDIKPASESATYTDAVGSLILPKTGSMFEFTEGGFLITKINYNQNRFDRGTIITLVFTVAGVQIVDGAFVKLHKPFTSESNSTIDFYTAEGDGLWQEIRRSTKKEYGYAAYELDSLLVEGSTTFFDIPVTGDKQFLLSNTAGTTKLIQRVNNTSSNRFGEDVMILITFAATSGAVEIQNNTYLNLAKSGSYFPVDGDWILLSTTGNGTWTEIQRKQSNFPTETKGITSKEIANIISGVIVTLPTTGENIFAISNTAVGTPQVITRINDANVLRFTPGTEIVLQFPTLTSAISITNSAYITLTLNGSYTPSPGDWIKLITNGTGTWTEITRKASAMTPSYFGSLTYNVPDVISGGVINLGKTGENAFTLNNTTGSSPQTITRFNDVLAYRFPAGARIILTFSTLTSAISLTNSGYIALAKTGNYTPSTGDWIELITDGGGLWKELKRKESVNINVTKGLSSVTYTAAVSANLATFVLTGENYFKINSTTAGGSITRINEASANRMAAGTVIRIKFTGVGTNAVTLVHSGYINLAGAVNYIPAEGKIITLITEGNGTWDELSRT